MHQEALTETGRRLFPTLARFDGFYLAGGTALALHIGHRLSIDFDLFTHESLPNRFLQQIKRIFPQSSIAVTYQAPEQLNVMVDGVRVTFLQYEYPLIEPLLQYEEVPIASVPEIAAMKAFAIGKRLSYKDYVDWYFLLLQQHVTLPQVLELADRKYRADFNSRLFLGQLASVGEIEEVPIEFLGSSVTKDQVREFLEETVAGFAL